MGRSARLAARFPLLVRTAAALAVAPLVLGSAALRAQSPPLYAPAAAELGGSPLALRAADLDGDGDDELVALLQDLPALGIARATGAGTFGAPTTVGLGGFGSSFALADLDADGDVDAAALTPANGMLFIAANDGAGNLAGAAALASFAGADKLYAGDLEGDGDIDAVAHTPVTQTPVLGWWLAAGGGAFDAAQTTALTDVPSMSALGDVDGDGALDFAAARNDSPSQPAPPLRVRRYVAGSGFASAVTSHPFGPANVQANRIELADLDLDGRDDLVATAEFVYFIHTSLSDGSGQFGPVVSTNTGESGIGLCVADFDGDGWPDVASAQSSNAISAFNVLWGGATGASGIGKHHAIGFSNLVDVATGDWDGDGRIDVAVAGKLIGRASIHLNLGARDFADVDFPLAFFTAQRDVECVDWNSDGSADIVTTTTSQIVFVYAADGNGAQVPVISLNVADVGVALAAGDLDGSGRVDFAHMDENGALVAFLSSGPGTFGAGIGAGSTNLASDLALGDVNLDGRLDLVTSALGGARVFAGNGDGTFVAPTVVPLGAPQCDRVAIADLDLNGVPDLVGLDEDTPVIGIAKGAGGGAFGAPASVAFGAPLLDFTVGHLDQDNKVDLVATALAGSGVWVAQNDATGGFLVPVPFALPDAGVGPVLFDANADGFADLVYAESADRRPRLAFGNGAAQFASSVALAEGPGIEAFALGDLDADGRCEIVGGATRVGIWRALAPPPAGTNAFGVGTSGCLGRMGIVAGSEPKIGTAKFDLSISNIGAGHGGFLVLAFAPDVAGTVLQPFGILVHVNLAGSFIYGAHGSGGPTGRWKAAIPNDPSLIGLQVAFQAAWPWTPLSPCDPSPLSLSTSRGLSVTLAP